MKNTAYYRKISSKEAQEGFIFILKSKLTFFPLLGSEFILSRNNSPRDVKVESYPCNCRGQDKPHEHYFISWEGLKVGDRIKITKSDQEGKYRLQEI